MKPILLFAMAALLNGALSAQETGQNQTHQAPASDSIQDRLLPEFNFSDAAETIRAIAAEAGTIDRQKYLQALHARSHILLSELKPLVEELRRHAPRQSAAAGEPPPPVVAQPAAAVATSVPNPPEVRLAAFERRLQELSQRLDALEKRVESRP